MKCQIFEATSFFWLIKSHTCWLRYKHQWATNFYVNFPTHESRLMKRVFLDIFNTASPSFAPFYLEASMSQAKQLSWAKLYREKNVWKQKLRMIIWAKFHCEVFESTKSQIKILYRTDKRGPRRFESAKVKRDKLDQAEVKREERIWVQQRSLFGSRRKGSRKFLVHKSRAWQYRSSWSPAVC